MSTSSEQVNATMSDRVETLDVATQTWFSITISSSEL